MQLPFFCWQRGCVGSNAVHGDVDCEFEPHDHLLVVSLEKALYSGFSCFEIHCAGGTGGSEAGLNTSLFLCNREGVPVTLGKIYMT